MGKNWCFTTSCLLKLYFAFCLIFYNINFQLLPRIVNFIFHGIFIMGIQGSGYLTHGKKVPQETSGFCLKHLKMTPPEELEVASALALKSISSFAFTKMPFHSQNCLLFSRTTLLFSRSVLLFHRIALLFSRSVLLFSRSTILFSKDALLFLGIALLFSRIVFLFVKNGLLFSRTDL